jgi:hypothetical protein
LSGFVLLFVVQNVFGQQVVKPVAYQLTPPVLEQVARSGVPVQRQPLTPAQEQLVLKLAARQP